MGAARPPVKVLSVTGAGRSGTTVLASILDGVDGFASAGEVRRLWERGVLEQRPCGCGRIPVECPVWRPVIEQTYATVASDDPADGLTQIVAAQHEVTAWRNRRRVLRSARGGGDDWPALRRVRAAMGVACTAFAAATQARVVVDTSKRAQDAAVLAGWPDLEHYVLHIVRDPRAVVHSWRQPKTFSAAGTTRTMQTRRLPSTVRRWLENCASTELLRRQLPPERYRRIRYEDFARAPREAVHEVMSLLGEHGEAPFEGFDTVQLGTNHIVAGNPSRFTRGSVTIRADEKWKAQMPRRDQRLVEWTTKPLMWRYGYGSDGARAVPRAEPS